MTRARLLRRAWAAVEYLGQAVLLFAALFGGMGVLYVLFGGPQ